MKILYYYNFSKIGEEQSSEDAEDGPPELLVNTAFFSCFVFKNTIMELNSTDLDFFLVYSRWSHCKDIRFCLESKRPLGYLQCIRG